MSDTMDMAGERLIWACALAIEKQYGDAASAHVAARIEALAVRDDEAGLERWRAIGARLDQLRRNDERASEDRRPAGATALSSRIARRRAPQHGARPTGDLSEMNRVWLARLLIVGQIRALT